MSIRIQNDQASDVAASQASRADALPGSTSSSGSKTGGLTSIGGDTIDISSSAQSISSTLQQHDADRAGRISHLTSLYAGGHYDVDASQVSHAIVSNAISGVSNGSEH